MRPKYHLIYIDVKSDSIIVFTMGSQGATIGFIFVSGMLIMTFLSFIPYLLWLLCNEPIGPAIRLAAERTYFSILLESQSSGEILKGIFGGSEDGEIWAQLDFQIRVGESLSTKDDRDLGKIVMDKPKFVVPLSKLKKYL